MRPIVAVVGNNDASPEVLAVAEALGRGLVERGFRLATGGLGGVMEAASRGAHSATGYREGDVIGVLPSGDRTTANRWVDIAIPTNLGYARNVLVVTMAEAVVAVGGGAGTLTEIAMAWQLDRPIVALEQPGWSEKLAGTAIDARPRPPILGAKSAQEAVELVARALGR
jgi:uncharacterized protein (TIGR00725 family)